MYAGAQTPGDTVVAPESEGQRGTVLIVSRDIETRLLYEKYFRSSLFRTIPARNAREARSIVDQMRPAAVILDGMSPDADGWELLIELKAREDTGGVPTIVISNMEDREKALSLGADAFGNRPVDRRWLLRHLTTLTGGQNPFKVLLIDDDEVSRYLIRQLFSGGDTEVIEASGGAEGLRCARDEQPNVIMLDLLMPDVNGFQVLERLHADARTAHIPVIVATSRVLDEADRVRLERWSPKVLPKSMLSDGTATLELSRICSELGLVQISGEALTRPA